jgi:ferredoxin-NADP reductase
VGAQLSGDFVLPKNKEEKLVFIAGGIGITPFRSMIKYLTDIKEARDIVLFYLAATPDEFVYKDVFENAKSVGVKTIYMITDSKNVPNGWAGGVGRISAEIIEKDITDFKTRKFYLSGPNAMVDNYKKIIKSMGIKRSSIITDYFPGY